MFGGALVVWPGMQFPNLDGRIHQSPICFLFRVQGTLRTSSKLKLASELQVASLPPPVTRIERVPQEQLILALSVTIQVDFSGNLRHSGANCQARKWSVVWQAAAAHDDGTEFRFNNDCAANRRNKLSTFITLLRPLPWPAQPVNWYHYLIFEVIFLRIYTIIFMIFHWLLTAQDLRYYLLRWQWWLFRKGLSFSFCSVLFDYFHFLYSSY